MICSLMTSQQVWKKSHGKTIRAQGLITIQGSHHLHVKSSTLPRYTWVVGFISLEQTSSLKVPFVEE